MFKRKAKFNVKHKGNLVDSENPTPEQEIAMELIKAQVDKALMILEDIFGHSKVFFIAACKKEDLSPQNMLIFQTSNCPACMFETIYESAQLMGLKHNGGEELFHLGEDEVKH